jgi:DNA-binding NtrC family response regulator
MEAARILVVDREVAIRRLLQSALTRAGYEVRTASGLEVALKACRAGPVDLVLADAGWSMDGHDLARQVAEECPGTRVVLMAAWLSECEKCPYAPQCPVVGKPFTVNQVLSVVAETLATPPGAGGTVSGAGSC